MRTQRTAAGGDANDLLQSPSFLFGKMAKKPRVIIQFEPEPTFQEDFSDFIGTILDWHKGDKGRKEKKEMKKNERKE